MRSLRPDDGSELQCSAEMLKPGSEVQGLSNELKEGARIARIIRAWELKFG